jgi:putative oxidoreductase
MAILGKLGNYKSTGLLLMRLGIGVMMVLHGYPKILGGPEKWAKLGGNMKHFGITAYLEIWGFMASLSESVGGVLLVLGFLFRPSAFFLLCTMIVASVTILKGGEAILDASHSIELGFVFLGMFILGPGKYSIDKD